MTEKKQSKPSKKPATTKTKKKEIASNVSPKVIIIKYIRLLDAIKEITKDSKNITIAERKILEKEWLNQILKDARKDKLTVGVELHDGRCIFLADKEDIYKFESIPYRTDITTKELGSVQFQYVPAKLKIIERRYNIFDKKSMKWVDEEGNPVPKWHTPLFEQAESLHKIKTEKTIDGKYKYHKIYYDITINNFVIPKREWERYKKRQKIVELLQSSQGKKKINAKETIDYEWRVDKSRDVYCNNKKITRLPNLKFKLFECLYKKCGKYVKNETLKKCWGDKMPNYESSLVTEISKIRSKLKRSLAKNKIPVKGEVIEPKQEKKQNVAYKLVT